MEEDYENQSQPTLTPKSCREKKVNPSKKGINLLKHSKSDLLRLLSILEGELEARDIFISTLQAQINNQRNTRSQYFVHKLPDPFLALHRDDHALGSVKSFDGDKMSSADTVRIEPLPLLEKVVYQFRTQQQKMHQQMALASKIHRKMAHDLAEERRKHAVDTKTGDDVTMALEKERERLRAGVLCERARTKRIETEYKKLLQLCKQDRKKHNMIVLMLLEEQQRLSQQLKESKELQIDLDSTETELQAKLHEVLTEKHELATRLREEQIEKDSLKMQVKALQAQVDMLKLAQKAKAPTHLGRTQSVTSSQANDTVPAVPTKIARISSENNDKSEDGAKRAGLLTASNIKRDSMSVAQSSQDVTLIPTSSHPPILLAGGVEGVTTSGYYSVKPGSSIAGLDAIKSTAQSKEMLNLDPPATPQSPTDVPDSKTDQPENHPHSGKNKNHDQLSLDLRPQPPVSTGTPKPNRFVPSVALRSLQSTFADRNQFSIASSPTSGAANFAMNSPNSPNPPGNSPFAVPRISAVKAAQKPDAGSQSKTPQKASYSSQFQATREKFQNCLAQQEAIKKDGDVKKGTQTTERKFQQKIEKKYSPVEYRPQVAPKTSMSSFPSVTKPIKPETSTGNESSKIRPLPPKTRPTTAPGTLTEHTSATVKPPPLPPKKPNLATDKVSRRTEAKKLDGKLQEKSSPHPPLRKPSSTKRTMSANCSAPKITTQSMNSSNNNNNNGTKRVKDITPPTLPIKMSAQQPIPPGKTRTQSMK